MRTSITITEFSWPAGSSFGGEMEEVARVADAAGIDSVFVSDHLLQMVPGTDPTEAMLEAYTTLGYLAGVTSRVRLGTMVAAVTMRPPALLVKAVTTLDVLSGGRAWFGVGAGYQQSEADDMGVPLPATVERFEWLEDTLQLALQMWSEKDAPFVGRRLRAGRPIGSPAPISSPHPPILIGGTGESKTLRLVARYGDACNLPDMPDGGALIRRKLDVLARHCAAEGRSLDQIDKTVSTRLNRGESADAFVDRARGLAGLGLDHLIVLTSGPWTADTLGTLAAAVPAIAGLPATTIDHAGRVEN
jgi:F420-dependent oxidoreductase-like protein